MNHYVVSGFGWALLLLGLAGFGIETDQLLSASSEQPVLGFVLAAAFVLGGGLVIRAGRTLADRAPAPARVRTSEDEVMDLAVEKGGLLTAVEVAAHTPLSFVEAEQELERLARLAACEADIDEEGGLIYRFRALAKITDRPDERG